MLHTALDLQAADAERSGLREQDVFTSRNVFRSAENTQNDARAIFLHLHWGYKYIQSADGIQAFANMTNRFARNVVEIGLQQHDMFGVFCDGRRADEDPKNVGSFGKRHRSAAAADRFDRHRRHWAETISQSFRDGGSGGRCQFRFDRHIGERNSLQNLCGPRSRHRTDPMVDFDKPSTRRNSIADHSLNPQQVKRHGNANDINDRIDRADFVEMDLLNR